MNLIQRLTRTEERAGLVQVTPTWANPTERLTGDMRKAYLVNSTVHAAINARQRVFSEVRFAIRNRRTNKLNTNHPNLDLLEMPWPGGTGTELLRRMELDVSLSGAAAVYRPNRNRLQVLDPMKLEVMSNGRERTGYLYWPDGIGNREGVPLLPEEVAYWAPMPHPAKQWVGTSWVEVVTTELRVAYKAIRHQEMFYDNGATLNMVVKVEGKLSPDSHTRMREQLDQRYAGVDNAYRTLVLDGGKTDVQMVGADNVQMDYAGVQKGIEARVASAAGVPPIILSLEAGLDASTYSNYGMAMRAFADHLVRPNWNSAVAALGQIVDVPQGSELWFDDSHVSALRQDKTEEASIQLTLASTIRQLVDGGFTPESAIEATTTQDMSKLKHTQLFSVQLQPPGDDEPETVTGQAEPDEQDDDEMVEA